MARIAIVGGGIAGLTLAAALDPGEHEVTLYEAQPERAGTGGALVLWPAARRVLAGLGAGPALAPYRRRVGPAALRDLTSGRARLVAPGATLTLVPRPVLLSALEALVPASVERVSAAVENPAQLSADVVVGADGVRSRVRGLVDPRATDRRQTPYVALRVMSPQPPPPGSVGEYWGGGRLFGVAPVGTGTYWFTSHRSNQGPEPLDVEQVLAEVRQRYADAAPALRALLADPGPDVLATRLWVAPPMRRYVRGRYVVVGDAAHAMTPNLGRGACDAVVDAASLARALSRGQGPVRLRRWQARRLPPTQGARVVSAGLMRVALSGD